MTADRDLLQVVATPHDDSAVSVFALSGELDMHTQPVLDRALADCAGLVVLDLRALTFLDSSGINAFVKLRRRLLDSGGGLRLVYGSAQQVARVLKILGLREVFPLYDDVRHASTQ